MGIIVDLIATKQRKSKTSQELLIMKDISDLSTHVMGRTFKWLHMWRNFIDLHICQEKKFEISPHDSFFLHGYDPLVPVTNIRSEATFTDIELAVTFCATRRVVHMDVYHPPLSGLFTHRYLPAFQVYCTHTFPRMLPTLSLQRCPLFQCF